MCFSSDTMKAIRVLHYGGPEVLALTDNVELPVPSDTQVLVEVQYAGINPVDTYIRTGKYIKKIPVPYTPGFDGSGLVRQVGSKVTSVQPGDKVYFIFCDSGSYAEFCIVEESSVRPLWHLGFEDGASIGVPYYTAARCLYQYARNHIGKGKRVLIHGASGAVGIASIQVAKQLGLEVFGTAGSERGLQLVKDNGAIKVFNHREQDYVEQILASSGKDGFDIILEMIADKNLASDLDLVAQNGIIIMVSARGNAEIDPRICMRKECSFVGMLLPTATPEEWQEMHSVVQDGIKTGWVRPHVSKIYEFNEVKQAHEDIIKTTSAQGKRILKIC